MIGRIESVIDKIIYLWNRISRKVEGTLAKSEEVVDFNELGRMRKKLAQMRYRSEGSESTGAFAMEAVRRRMTCEIDSEGIAKRAKTREIVNKWFNKEEQVDTGSFNAVDFDKRIKEVFYESEERPLEPLPAVEDTFMAFSRSEDNLFEEESISLSGVHYRVDPLEDFDETYDTPALLPMYGSVEEEVYDFSPLTTSFAPQAEDAVDPIEAVQTTASNPMLQVLGELEERMAINQQRRDAYWVAD